MAVIDRTGEIIYALTRNTTITNWAGKINGIPNITSGRTPSATFPAIVIYTVFNRDSEYADDEAYASALRYQVTLFSTQSIPNSIAGEVDDELKFLGFTRNNLYPLYDEDTRVYQTVMLFDNELTY